MRDIIKNPSRLEIYKDFDGDYHGFNKSRERIDFTHGISTICVYISLNGKIISKRIFDDEKKAFDFFLSKCSD